jgi:hypothetical protein
MTTILDLIEERRADVKARIEAVTKAMETGEATGLWELDPLADELVFLKHLAEARRAELLILLGKPRRTDN